MQVVTLVAIPVGMAFAIWRAYRANARARQDGEHFAPRGKIRWEGQGDLVGRDEA